MGWLDKLLGRSKKAAGETMGGSPPSREGMYGQATAEEPAEHGDTAMEEHAEAAEHHHDEGDTHTH